MKLYKSNYKGNDLINFDDEGKKPFGLGKSKIGTIVKAYKENTEVIEAFIAGNEVDLPDYAEVRKVSAKARAEKLREQLAKAEAEAEA